MRLHQSNFLREIVGAGPFDHRENRFGQLSWVNPVPSILMRAESISGSRIVSLGRRKTAYVIRAVSVLPIQKGSHMGVIRKNSHAIVVHARRCIAHNLMRSQSALPRISRRSLTVLGNQPNYIILDVVTERPWQDDNSALF